MIKIYNPKPLEEIQELRDKGLYNAPFSVLEAMGKVEINTNNEEVEEKLNEAYMSQVESIAEIYEEINTAKEQLKKDQEQLKKDQERIKQSQVEMITELYESMGGM